MGNQFVKHARMLKLPKNRKKEAQFLGEGIQVIFEALSVGMVPKYVLYSDQLRAEKGGKVLLDRLFSLRVPCYRVEERLFNKTADSKIPQGIMGIFQKPVVGWELVPWANPNLLLLIADRVQDPGNLGTIIRTALACGCNVLILTQGCTDAYSPKTVRSTAGAIFKLPVLEDVKLRTINQKLDAQKVRIIAADPGGDQVCFKADLVGRVALAVGNESQGLDKNFLSLASERVRIPVKREMDSLNVSVAAGMLLYETLRQRHYKLF